MLVSGEQSDNFAAYLFHIGDSRIYRLSAETGEFKQLTRDHTAGISKDENYLIRAMGMDTSLNVDSSIVTLHPGDIFFLSTDGIHDFLPEAEIHALIEKHPNDYNTACEAIVDAARTHDSNDNLSC